MKVITLLPQFLPTADLITFVSSSELADKRGRPQVYSRIPADYTCRKAARGGHLEVLKWLREKGCPWDAWACTEAARYDHLAVLKWLRSQDPPCPWDESACSEAAWGGHLDVLKWLRENGCPWDIVCRGTSHTHIRTYLDENDCPDFLE